MSNVDTGKLCPSSEQKANTSSCRPGCKITECPSYGSPGCRCRIRDLNDQLRTRMFGGLIHMTKGIAALGMLAVNAIFQAVSQFSAFTQDNDPWGEHDCATLEVEGQRIIWKIDYFDRSLTYHSPDAADRKVTVRVLTVMLASEY